MAHVGHATGRNGVCAAARGNHPLVRRQELAAARGAGGRGIVFGWTAARIIKAYVDRGRPGTLIENVSFGWRTPIDTYGYLSGHAVVAVTLAVVLSPYMPRWLRWSLYGLAAVVCFSRMYMGPTSHST
jgi:membrane-associated phospholipid phosphatase